MIQINNKVNEVLSLMNEGLTISQSLLSLNIEKGSFYKSLNLLAKKRLTVAATMNSNWPQSNIGVNMNYIQLDSLYRNGIYR